MNMHRMVMNDALREWINKLPELFPVGSDWYAPDSDVIWRVVGYDTENHTPEWWSHYHPLDQFHIPVVRMIQLGSGGQRGIKNVGEWIETGWWLWKRRVFVDKWEEYITESEYGVFNLGNLARLIPLQQWELIQSYAPDRM